jgi:hypothetical protein
MADNNNESTIATDLDISGFSADELRDKLAAIHAGHEAFREQVRNRAIRGFHDGEWDMNRLNTTLESLGLAKHEPKRLVRSLLRLEVMLEADTEDVDRAWGVVQDLENLRARQDFKEAITNVVQAHLSEDLAFTSSDSTLGASVGYPHVENA